MPAPAPPPGSPPITAPRLQTPACDGIHALVPRDQMSPAARKRRDTYALTPDAPLLRQEFGFMEGTLEAWKKQGMPENVARSDLFLLEPGGDFGLGRLGWCEAAFAPAFEVKIVEDRGATEVEQDAAGRLVLYFKGRRQGFMPEYLTHPVQDRRTWEDNVRWRLNPATEARFAGLDQRMVQAKAAAARGQMITQGLIGGYMYLRSLMGPEELLYKFHDDPDLIQACMQAWFELADAIIARHQQHITLDEIFFAEDICYNHGPLISPDMMRRFLIPYYQQLLTNLRRRQLDRTRHLYVQIDTDGDCRPTIPVYMKDIALDVMSPFEVAAGCDVVEIGKEYPNLVLRGGIDKRVLVQGKEAIDRMLEAIIPPMRRRGGYIPMHDHSVPAETPYENYLYYRQRCVELGG